MDANLCYQVVLIGGLDPASQEPLDDVWIFDSKGFPHLQSVEHREYFEFPCRVPWVSLRFDSSNMTAEETNNGKLWEIVFDGGQDVFSIQLPHFLQNTKGLALQQLMFCFISPSQS